jgi:hypothetical protein
MATARAFEGFNMFSPIKWAGDYFAYTAHSLMFVDYSDNNHAIFKGSFIVEDDDVTYELISGTVDEFAFYTSEILAVQVRTNGLNMLDIFDGMIDRGMLDGDPAAYSYMFQGNDSFTGSSYRDVLRGFAGSDTLNGAGGNDFLRGDNGNDTLIGGAGNDTMVWDARDRFNGSTGEDTLKLISGNANFVPSSGKVINAERIDMRGGDDSTLTLNRADVLEISSVTDNIAIFGDPEDTVNISGAFDIGAVSGKFTTYLLGGGVVLSIETDVQVI